MKRILLVDDDTSILQHLRSALKSKHREWHVEQAESGEEGLRQLLEHRYDVVVSDFSLSVGMSGEEFLGRVRDTDPSTIRIVLSEQADKGSPIRAVTLAHQFVSKPCTPEMLLHTLERACSLSELVEDEALRDVVGSLEAIPEPPHTYFECCRVLEDEDSTPESVAEVVRGAPNLAAKLLQMVNSAYFALPQQTSDIEKAIGFLGVDTVRGLVLALEATAVAEDAAPIGPISLDSVLQASVLCANVSRKMKLPTKEFQEQLFTSCLLHDIGLLVLLKNRPEFIEAAADLAKANEISLIAAEEQLGLPSYASVGAYLLGAWGLPLPIVEAVRDHVPHPVGKGRLALAVHLIDVAAKSTLAEHHGVNELTRTAPMEAGLLTLLGADRLESLRARARDLVEPDSAAAA